MLKDLCHKKVRMLPWKKVLFPESGTGLSLLRRQNLNSTKPRIVMKKSYILMEKCGCVLYYCR